MKILITGVAGFIGSHTAEKFLEEGHQVVGIDDYSTGNHRNVPDDVGFFCYDVTDYKIMEEVIAEVNPDAIIHLAAQPSLLESVEYPEFDASVNIIGTINLAKIARDLGVSRFVFSSTSAVYSSPDTREDTLEFFPDTPYGISKRAAELYIRSLLPNTGVVLRYGNVYGPRQVPLGENQIVPRVLDHIYGEKKFEIYGDGKQTRDYVYVKDVANANYLAITEPLPEDFAFNVGTGKDISVIDLLKEIAGLTAFTGKFDVGPGKLGERRQVIMPSSLIKEQLGWEPEFSLHEGLKKTVLSYGK